MDTDALRCYVDPQGKLPEIRCSGDLLVIGSAKCVWEDLRRYDHKHQGDRMGVNEMLQFFPGILQHGITLHPEKLPAWRFLPDQQAEKEHRPRMKVHSNHDVWPQHLVDYVWPIHRDGGTSGIFGAIVGLLMGYSRVILAGIPCDRSPRFFDPYWKMHSLFGSETANNEWQMIKEVFQGRVTSLSGRTKDILGGPDA